MNEDNRLYYGLIYGTNQRVIGDFAILNNKEKDEDLELKLTLIKEQFTTTHLNKNKDLPITRFIKGHEYVIEESSISYVEIGAKEVNEIFGEGYLATPQQEEKQPFEFIIRRLDNIRQN